MGDISRVIQYYTEFSRNYVGIVWVFAGCGVLRLAGWS